VPRHQADAQATLVDPDRDVVAVPVRGERLLHLPADPLQPVHLGLRLGVVLGVLGLVDGLLLHRQLRRDVLRLDVTDVLALRGQLLHGLVALTVHRALAAVER
jgi:hypothetical protein